MNQWEERAEQLYDEWRSGTQVEERFIRIIAAALQERDERFVAYTKVVSEFLNDLYAIMIDPLAEGEIKVTNMADQILEQAKKDRESLAEIFGLRICSVCGNATDLACSDCRIDLRTTVYVCKSSECRSRHEEKCGQRIAAILANLSAQIEAQTKKGS